MQVGAACRAARRGIVRLGKPDLVRGEPETGLFLHSRVSDRAPAISRNPFSKKKTGFEIVSESG
jgi:hypothetical protein